MSSSSVNGVNQLDPIVAYYVGSDTIGPGYALCYYYDGSTATIRASQVKKPTYNALMNNAFAGVLTPNHPTVVGDGNPKRVTLVPVLPEGMANRDVNVFTDENVTAGDILGPIPDSYAFGRGVFPGCACFIAGETKDRSVTNGVVNGRFGKINQWDPTLDSKLSRHFDHFRSTNVDKVVANVATGTAGHYLLNGTTAVAFQNTNGSTPAGTGVGELSVVGTTTTIGQIQQSGAQYLLSEGRSLFCRMRVKIDDISDEDWFFGLGTPPTVSAGVLTAVAQVTSGGTTPAGTDYIGFFFDGSADAGVVQANIRKASGTEQTAATTATLVNNTYVELAFLARNRLTGASAGYKTVQTYVNGVLSNTFNTAAVAAAFPNTVPLAWAMSGITGGCIGTIDYLDIIANH